MPAASWSLATVDVDGSAVACLETADGLFALEPSLARAGLPGQSSVAGLFTDWPAAEAALARAAGSADPVEMGLGHVGGGEGIAYTPRAWVAPPGGWTEKPTGVDRASCAMSAQD